MSVLCLLVGILLCSAELFCDKLLTQQQLQQPLFLRLSFCHSLYSTCLLPFHSCLGIVCQLFFFPCLLCHILSNHVSSLFLTFSLPFLSCPILSYPILDVFTSIPISLPILLHLFFFLSYPILSFVSLPVSLLILSVHIFLHPFLPILSYPILSCPVLCFRITCFFAHPILSNPLASHFFISYVILTYAFASRPVPLPILSFHFFCILLSFPFLSFPFLSFPFLFLSVPLPVLSFHIFSHPFFICLFYLILSTAVTSLLFLCIPFSSSLFFLLFLSCRLGFYFRN